MSSSWAWINVSRKRRSPVVQVRLGRSAQRIDMAICVVDPGPAAVAAVAEQVAVPGEDVPVLGVVPDGREVAVGLLAGRSVGAVEVFAQGIPLGAAEGIGIGPIEVLDGPGR